MLFLGTEMELGGVMALLLPGQGQGRKASQRQQHKVQGLKDENTFKRMLKTTWKNLKAETHPFSRCWSWPQTLVVLDEREGMC